MRVSVFCEIEGANGVCFLRLRRSTRLRDPHPGCPKKLLRHALTAALVYWLLADGDNAWPEFAVPSGPCSGRRRNPKVCEVATAVLRPKDVFGRLGGEDLLYCCWRPVSRQPVPARNESGFFAQDCRFARECLVIATVSGGMSASVKSEQTLEELLHVPTLRSTARCKGPRGGTGARYRKAHATRNTFDIPPSGSGCSDRLMRFRRPWRTTDPRPPPT